MKRKKRKHISKSKHNVRSSTSNSSDKDSTNKCVNSNSDTCSQNEDTNNEQSNCSSNNDDKNNQSTNDNSNSEKSKLCYFSAFDYFVLSSTLAIALAEELSDTDIDILSTFLATLSDQLALIGSVNSCEQGERENIFVPPIPAGTSSGGRCSTSSSSKKRSKKIVKRKIKKK